MSSLNKSQDFNPDELDAAIYSCLQRNKQNINKEKLRRIHKDCNIMYNSVNVLCGRQGSGKTFTSMKEAIKISMLSPETHLLVIVCKDETSTDPTVESLKPLLQIPIVYVAEDDAVEYVKKLLDYKRFYDFIKSEHLENKIVDEQVEEEEQSSDILNKLKMNGDSKSGLMFLDSVLANRKK